MRQVTMHAAKTQLSKLVRAVEAGEEVVILRGRKPVARLVAATPPTPVRRFGVMKGLIELTDEFFLPLPPEYLGLDGEEP